MSDKKTLNINPDLFSFSGNTTRKKRNKSDGANGIKVKAATPKKKDDTLKKKSILKMIRQHQEDRYKKLFEEDKNPIKKTVEDNTFNKDFQEARLFLENLTEKKEHNDKLKNHTIKNYPNNTTNSMLFNTELSDILPANDVIRTNLMNVPPVKINPLVQPKYGCLKNGALPTYRNYMNQTRKNVSQPTIVIGGGSPTPSSNGSNVFTPNNPPSSTEKVAIGGARNEFVEKRITESINKAKEMNMTAAKLNEMKKQMRPRKMKQKRTKRRTYKIGKSKVLPKVSVLVSNKTIRNNITTKKQLLQQVSLQDVKTYLVKRGFIKVGSTAPSDVLRKMYESAVMICGEVQNHNPENLLYNYLNGAET